MSNVRILIVDDERNIAYTLAQAVRRASGGDFQVMTRSTAVEALTLLRQQTFDLVISDLRLPGMSGLELLANIRQEHPDTRTILMTGFGSAQVEAEARQLTDAYLAKPFNLPNVVQLIRRVVRDPKTGAATQIVIVDDDLSHLSRCLDDLRINVGALYIMLLDLSGHTLVDSGDPGPVDKSVLNALLCSSMAASGELARALEERRAFDLHYFDGERYEIYLRKVNDSALLALVIDLHTSNAKMGSVWLYLKRAVEQVRKQAAKSEMPVAPQSPTPLAALTGSALDQALDSALYAEAGERPASPASPVNAPTEITAEIETIALEEAIRRGLLNTGHLGIEH